MSRSKIKVSGMNTAKVNKNSKFINVVLFILIFILSVSTIITIQIKSADNMNEYQDNNVEETNSDFLPADNNDNDGYNNEIMNNIHDDEDIEVERKINKYILPADGEIILSYSDTDLQYSPTMDDWRIHSAVDIAVDEGEIIKSMNDGIVSEILNDDFYGTTIVIEHDEGIYTKYSNVDLCDGLMINDEVTCGMLIGYVNENPPCECSDKLHLHLQAYKDNFLIDPLSLIER